MFEEDLFKINQELEEIKEIHDKIFNDFFAINNCSYKIKRIVKSYQDQIDFENKERELDRQIYLSEKNQVEL
jgi:hypothetical protein